MSFVDYCLMANITPETHLALSECPDDLVPQPEADKVVIGTSKIHGKGVFPVAWFELDQEIGLLLDRKMRRTALIGRWINHEDKPNARMRPIYSRGMVLMANKPIFTFDEITMDYYDTLLLKRILHEGGMG